MLDTNIALFHLQGRLVEPLPKVPVIVSVITEIELLSYPKLTREENLRIDEFLRDVTIVGLNREIVAATVALRRESGLKLPDAIIGATALVLSAMLISNDSRFSSIKQLEVKSLSIKDLC